MKKPVILFSIILTIAFSGVSNSFPQSKNSIEEANNLYAAQKYTEASEIYKNLLGEITEPDEKAKVTYNLAMTFRQLKKFDEATANFQKTLTINVSNRPIKQGILNTYENYHHNAQLEIAKIQFETGDFENALKSFRDTAKKYPFKSDCGTCIRDESYKTTLFEAATLEFLNRYNEAFNAYFKIGHPRLFEIYAANGQLEKLSAIIKKKNAPVIEEYKSKYSYGEEKINYFLPTRTYIDFFRFYELGKSGNTDALMSELRKLSASPQDNYLKDWTAQMLAKNPGVSVPLISAELKNLKTYPFIFYRTLGFAATPEAVGILKNQAAKSNGWFDAESITASLVLAGEAGKKALTELENKSLPENMKLAIQKYRNGELNAKNYEEIKFAPLFKSGLPDYF